MEQERSEGGKFAAKGEVIRSVRSIRLTDRTWQVLGERADEEDMTRADFLEALASEEVEWGRNNDQLDLDFDLDQVGELLKEALTLKANTGGKIKLRIKEALQLMGIDPED